MHLRKENYEGNYSYEMLINCCTRNYYQMEYCTVIITIKFINIKLRIRDAKIIKLILNIESGKPFNHYCSCNNLKMKGMMLGIAP